MSETTQEQAAIAKAEWINEMQVQLLVGAYSPFLPDNIREAMSEINFPDSCMLAAYLSSAAKSPSSTEAQVHCTDFMVRILNEYWQASSLLEAERLYDEKMK